MSEDRRSKPAERFSIGYLFWRIASLDPKEVSDEEVDYFHAHPDQIDEISSPLTLHKLILWLGLAAGVLLTAASKLLSHGALTEFLHPGVEEFVIDIVFEIGVALIGAAIVTFMISLTLNEQQASAKKWRKEIRRRIAERR